MLASMSGVSVPIRNESSLLHITHVLAPTSECFRCYVIYHKSLSMPHILIWCQTPCFTVFQSYDNHHSTGAIRNTRTSCILILRSCSLNYTRSG